MTLLEETLSTIRRCKNTDNPLEEMYNGYAMTSDGYMTGDEFYKLAKDCEYDGGWGIQEIRADLMFVFKDGSWLERHEYDGSEWWEYKVSPKKPDEHFVPATLFDEWYRAYDDEEEEMIDE